MTACVSDNQSDLEGLGYIKTIKIVGPDKITFEPISGASQTKATSVDNGSALVFNWAAGDTLGIFPNKGNQVEFPITSQESSTSATFDGGGWALRNNASYAAYYPFSVWNYFQDNKTIVLDYSGQVQNGNGSFAHLSAYDFLASAKTTPENNSVTFQMDRQGSILYIDIVVPEPATITSLTISCDEAIFVEKAALDISGNNPVVTPIETKTSLTLAFENTATTEQNETVRAYMAIQPLDFSNKTVTATLRTTAGAYTAPVVSRVVNKGKAAFLRFSDSFTAPTAHEAVDLGLTSGVKWATCNVGASAPEEYGDYFAWGETEPYYSSQDPLTWKDGKTGYNWASYKYELGTGWQGPFSKYVTENSDNIGNVDNNTELDPEDDAAAVNWGGSWRMPTIEEWQELLDECTWTWTTQNGVSGRLVTSNTNGNSIFLPAAGDRTLTYLDNAGSLGVYWSSSLNTDYPRYAYDVIFDSYDVYRDYGGRYNGLSVRPVTDEGVRVSVTGVSLNKDGLDLVEGESVSLTASVTPSNATQPTVIWSSSDNTVATVDYTGKVTAVAAGSATITATTYDGGFTATCAVTVNSSSPAFVPEAVDLGLPSGLKWASCNLGASVPEEYGDYFAWGETEPYYISQNPLTWKDGKEAGYDDLSYQWCNDSFTTHTKYCTNNYYGTVDNKSVLEPEDDAAFVNWGGSWRMPTAEEWAELEEKCNWSYITMNGVYGSLVTSKANGNSIFLPYAGHWGGTDLNYTGPNGVDGLYWTSSLNTDYPSRAWLFYFFYVNVSRTHYGRYLGFSVRPVSDEGVRVSVTGVSLNNNSLNLVSGETASLTATVTPSNATQPNVIWSSSDNSVATVDYTGIVTAVAAGTATITAKTYDGGFTATCAVTVNSSSPAFVPEAVDLGLTSGLKWATCNVGANARRSTVITSLGEPQYRKNRIHGALVRSAQAAIHGIP